MKALAEICEAIEVHDESDVDPTSSHELIDWLTLPFGSKAALQALFRANVGHQSLESLDKETRREAIRSALNHEVRA